MSLLFYILDNLYWIIATLICCQYKVKNIFSFTDPFPCNDVDIHQREEGNVYLNDVIIKRNYLAAV